MDNKPYTYMPFGAKIEFVLEFTMTPKQEDAFIGFINKSYPFIYEDIALERQMETAHIEQEIYNNYRIRTS